MRIAALRGPKPVVGAAILGLLIGFAHGTYRATQVDTNAPVVEAARGWFVGMIIMVILVCAFGRISDEPPGTPLLGHFVSWSKTLQRILVAIPLALIALLIYFSTSGGHPHPDAAGPISVALTVGAIVAAVLIVNVIGAVYGLKPRTAGERIKWRAARAGFFANLRRAPARESIRPKNELDEFCRQAEARQNTAESKAQLDAAYGRYLEDLAAQERADTTTERDATGSDDKPPTAGRRPPYLDRRGRLITPRELTSGDDLPPIP